jgi:hypothetical protein
VRGAAALGAHKGSSEGASRGRACHTPSGESTGTRMRASGDGGTPAGGTPRGAGGALARGTGARALASARSAWLRVLTPRKGVVAACRRARARACVWQRGRAAACRQRSASRMRSACRRRRAACRRGAPPSANDVAERASNRAPLHRCVQLVRTLRKRRRARRAPWASWRPCAAAHASAARTDASEEEGEGWV